MGREIALKGLYEASRALRTGFMEGFYMDIWEKTMLNGEKVYKCPDCGCYSYVNLNFCPECGDHMRTSGGKLRFEGLKKRHLGVLRVFARVRNGKEYTKCTNKTGVLT